MGTGKWRTEDRVEYKRIDIFRFPLAVFRSESVIKQFSIFHFP